MSITSVKKPAWLNNNVQEQITVIPKSALSGQPEGIKRAMQREAVESGRQPVPAVVNADEMIVPAEAVEAAGGPQGVQQALNSRLKQNGMAMQGAAGTVGDTLQRSYAGGTIGGLDRRGDELSQNSGMEQRAGGPQSNTMSVKQIAKTNAAQAPQLTAYDRMMIDRNAGASATSNAQAYAAAQGNRSAGIDAARIAQEQAIAQGQRQTAIDAAKNAQAYAVYQGQRDAASSMAANAQAQAAAGYIPAPKTAAPVTSTVSGYSLPTITRAPTISLTGTPGYTPSTTPSTTTSAPTFQFAKGSCGTVKQYAKSQVPNYSLGSWLRGVGSAVEGAVVGGINAVSDKANQFTNWVGETVNGAASSGLVTPVSTPTSPTANPVTVTVPDGLMPNQDPIGTGEISQHQPGTGSVLQRVENVQPSPAVLTPFISPFSLPVAGASTQEGQLHTNPVVQAAPTVAPTVTTATPQSFSISATADQGQGGVLPNQPPPVSTGDAPVVPGTVNQPNANANFNPLAESPSQVAAKRAAAEDLQMRQAAQAMAAKQSLAQQGQFGAAGQVAQAELYNANAGELANTLQKLTLENQKTNEGKAMQSAQLAMDAQDYDAANQIFGALGMRQVDFTKIIEATKRNDMMTAANSMLEMATTYASTNPALAAALATQASTLMYEVWGNIAGTSFDPAALTAAANSLDNGTEYDSPQVTALMGTVIPATLEWLDSSDGQGALYDITSSTTLGPIFDRVESGTATAQDGQELGRVISAVFDYRHNIPLSTTARALLEKHGLLTAEDVPPPDEEEDNQQNNVLESGDLPLEEYTDNANRNAANNIFVPTANFFSGTTEQRRAVMDPLFKSSGDHGGVTWSSGAYESLSNMVGDTINFGGNSYRIESVSSGSNNSFTRPLVRVSKIVNGNVVSMGDLYVGGSPAKVGDSERKYLENAEWLYRPTTGPIEYMQLDGSWGPESNY